MGMFIANYVKAGLIGWAVWFVLAVIFVIMSFGTDLSLYRDANDNDGKKSRISIGAIIALVLWPIGMLRNTHVLVRHVEQKKGGR